jgi:hypothetical protein
MSRKHTRSHFRRLVPNLNHNGRLGLRDTVVVTVGTGAMNDARRDWPVVSTLHANRDQRIARMRPRGGVVGTCTLSSFVLLCPTMPARSEPVAAL